MNKLNYSPLILLAMVFCAPSFSGDNKQDDAETTDVPQYVIEDGKVDKATFNGYRRFHGTCHACHGQDAAGGSFAPALTESLKTLSYDEFRSTVLEGRQAKNAAGELSVMPAFAQDPNIAKHLDDIYRYVKARAVGGLGTGRPPKIKVKK